MNPHPILSEVEAFCATHGITEATFGRKAMNDWRLVQELRGSEERRPRRLWPETESTIRHFMATYRPAPQDQAA